MDRKGIIAVSLAIAVLVLWQIKFAPKYMPPADEVASPTPGEVSGGSEGVKPSGDLAGGAPAVAAALSGSGTGNVVSAETAKVPLQLTTAKGAQADYYFTNHGGGIARVDLTSYPAESGSNVNLNADTSAPIGALSEEPGVGADLPYTVTVQGSNVVCTRETPDGLTITKKYTLDGAEAHGYRVALEVSYANHGATTIKSAGYYLYLGSAAPVHKNDLPTYLALDWDAPGKSEQHIDVTWFNEGRVPLIGYQTHPERPIYTGSSDQMGWAGVSNQYFTTVLSLPDENVGKGTWARRFTVAEEDAKPEYGIESAIQTAGFSLAPGQSVTQRYEIYAGPKFYATLKGLGGGEERIITYFFSFWGMSIFRPVSVLLLNLMNTLHHYTGSYAVAIILLTLIIRGLLWPVQNKATASMRQMQALQPRMAELKEKYKDDPTKMNAEVMRLYKEYNVNPVAGCLPMFVQIPIFFGFYRVLGTAIELRNSKFLWVHDLSQPDTIFHLMGAPVNVLPICMAVTMIAQMQLQPKTGDPAQQRMFMFVPLIFVFVCYNFASALALYWTVQNVFSITQLYVTRARTAPAPVKASPKKRSR